MYCTESVMQLARYITVIYVTQLCIEGCRERPALCDGLSGAVYVIKAITNAQ